MKKILSFALAFLMIFSFAACGADVPAERDDPEIPEISENPEKEPETEEKTENPERKEVSAENFENAAEIVLTGNGASADEKHSGSITVGGEIIYYHDIEKYESGRPYGEGEKEDRHTEEEASEYTLVTITEPGEYFIRGELKGQLAVDLGEDAKNDPNAKVTLIFGGADISCKIAPAVIFYNVYECGSSENPVMNPDTSKAGANVLIADGSLSNINGANVAKIFKDEEEEKKLHKYDAAFYSRMSMNIEGGTENSGILNITGENEGLGTEMHLTLNGGNVSVVSKDDGINVNEDGVSVITVNGGKLTVKGGNGIEGDGIDSNGWLVINGGEVYSYGNGRSGDGGIDADSGIFINGGKVTAFGSRNDYVNDESKQLFVCFDFASVKEAGSKIRFAEENGTEFVFESEREFQSVVISDKKLSEGGKYSLYVNGILQEYVSNISRFDFIVNKDDIISFEGINNRVPKDEYPVPGIPEAPEKNIYSVPEGFENWLSSEKDIPKEIREWIELMAEESERIAVYANRNNGSQNAKPEASVPGRTEENKENSLVLEEDLGGAVFVLEKGKIYFSGIYDSPSATGKEYAGFTINGTERFDDIFYGDLPEINSIECTKKVPSEQVEVTLVYTGRDEAISVFRKCLLSDGIEAVIELFKDLEPGDYRLAFTVSDENEEFCGSTVFSFDVVD